MATETEHKYLVDAELWKHITPDKSAEIKQAYLFSTAEKTVRVRTAGEKGFITIKGKSVGASRPEYEYEIPLADANEMIKNFCDKVVEKTRHYVSYKNKTWEVDVFESLNAGLIVAEIELDSEDEKYAKPDWVGKDVTDDKRYANANLAVRPYSEW